jgi:hypothetical protein
MNIRFKDGQILNCEYGHCWPLNLFTEGFVRINIITTRRGNLKVRYTWAETREELA